MKEFLEEIGADGGTIFGCAADVVDRASFGEEGCASGGEGFRGDRLVEERLFGGGKTRGVLAHAGGADADIFDAAAVYAGEHSYCDFGDCLSVACAYFANVGFVT